MIKYRKNVYRLCKIVTGSYEMNSKAQHRARNIPDTHINNLISLLSNSGLGIEDLWENEYDIINKLFGDSW